MNTLDLYRKATGYPFGERIFTWMFCRKLPYFKSIRPKILDLEEGRAVVRMKERRSIQNHIPSIHAIALCNLCEAAMALAASSAIPGNLRFIPSGMNVSYKKIAKGTVRAVATIAPEGFKIGETDIPVHIYNEQDENVMSAVITVNVREK
jgi:uncharacterized protein (TIGR00369 family)